MAPKLKGTVTGSLSFSFIFLGGFVMPVWLCLVAFIAGIIFGVSIHLIYLKLTAVGTLEVKPVENGGSVVGLSVNSDSLMRTKRGYALVAIRKMERSWSDVDDILRAEGSTKSRRLWIMHRLNELYPQLETCPVDRYEEIETRINNLEAELQELEGKE